MSSKQLKDATNIEIGLEIATLRPAQSFNIGLWCNGNTGDFGPSVMGSSPVSPTIKLSSLTYWYNKYKTDLEEEW